jgi:hypothetical protein
METITMEQPSVHYYEILCLDDGRTHSAWLTHDLPLSREDLYRSLKLAERSFSEEEIERIRREQGELSETLLEAARVIRADPSILARLEKRVNRGLVYADVLEPLTKRMCALQGFRRVVPTSVAHLPINEPFPGWRLLDAE